MTRTAIVTLSCPHCGGRADGVRSIEAPQTLPCPYCRTELHVPRVGERVIERERIIERVVEVTPKPEPMNPVVAWFLVLLFGVGALILMVMKCSASSVPPSTKGTWESKQVQRQDCTRQCVASCPTAERTVEQIVENSSLYNPTSLDRAIARSTCTANCDLTCLGMEPLSPRR